MTKVFIVCQVFDILAGVFFLYNMICVSGNGIALCYAYLVSYVIFDRGLGGFLIIC